MFYYHYPIIGREGRLPIYLFSIGMHDCQPLVRRGTEYGFPQIFYCTKGRGVLRIDSTERLDRIFAKMHEALQYDRVYGNMRTSGYLYDFLIELDRAISHTGTSAEADPAVLKCIDLIDREYTRRITMDDLCAVTGLSKQHICRLFRNALDTRPMEYAAKRRIQAAKELLSETDLTTEEIAVKVGFGSSSYFCKLFRRYEGITPMQFRNIR